MKNFSIGCGVSLLIFSCLYLTWAVTNFKAHDFQGQCRACHKDNPDKNTNKENLQFIDEIDKLCAKCHAIDSARSHPIKVKPDKNIPLSIHLDKNGEMTCTTCHDVHKEDGAFNSWELPGLLWGHVRGKEFCYICHNKEVLDVTWRHKTAIPYAHSSGKLIENAGGSILDKFSVECLSCHDGIISKFPQVQVKQGLWQHGIGMSHPIGIDYPRSQDFTNPESLPKEIRLFAGKLGCLSCHEIYGQKAFMLAMNNKGSRLCLACHKK